MACNDVSHEYAFVAPSPTHVMRPRLSIAEQQERTGQSSPRRDSLSSSTGDSGYNSGPDPDLEGDVLLSPLEFEGVDPVAYPLFNLIPDLPPPPEINKAVNSWAWGEGSVQPTNLALLKKHKSFQKPSLTPKIEVTSYPSPPSVLDPQIPPNWVGIPQDYSPSRPPAFEETHLAQKHIIPWIPDNLTVESSPKERNCSIVSFSSTGSCEMYSSSNNSDDEDNGPFISSLTATRSSSVSSKLSKAALTTIELILRKIELYLNHAAYLQCVERSETQLEDAMNTVNISKGSANRNRNTNNNTHASQSNSKTNKRKSRQTDDPLPRPNNTNSFYSNNQNNADSDDEDDPNNKRRRISVTTTAGDSDPGPKFACPFYKHDPGRYRTRRTCAGPGWRTVHRMKEHLYRAHGQSIHCARCYTMFNSDVELSTHLRTSSCPISEALPVEGIDRETLDRLRKRTPANKLEEDKWRDAYLLLFPEVDAADCPSPYYTLASPTEESIRFRRELLERVRTELFATAERESESSVEQRLLSQVAAIIQRCETELLETFPANRTSSTGVPRRPSEIAGDVILRPPPVISNPSHDVSHNLPVIQSNPVNEAARQAPIHQPISSHLPGYHPSAPAADAPYTPPHPHPAPYNLPPQIRVQHPQYQPQRQPPPPTPAPPSPLTQPQLQQTQQLPPQSQPSFQNHPLASSYNPDPDFNAPFVTLPSPPPNILMDFPFSWSDWDTPFPDGS